MATVTITDDEEGKRVVDASGNEIGMITEVRGGTAYVDPDPGMFDTIKSKLGWGDVDEDTYPLSANRIDAITDDEVRLNRL